MNQRQDFEQKPLQGVIGFWDSTAQWRLSYFDDLARTPDCDLSMALRCEKEFVIREHAIVDELVAGATSILELGCGVGRSIIHCISKYPTKRFLGVDVAPKQLRLFQERLHRGNTQNAQAVMANVRDLPISDRSIDLVLICNQTFGNFLGKTRDACMREIARVLTQDGRLMIGGFTNKTLIEPCYRAWNVPIESIDYDSGFVELAAYNTWWQSYDDLTSYVVSFGFERMASARVLIGFIDIFRKI